MTHLNASSNAVMDFYFVNQDWIDVIIQYSDTKTESDYGHLLKDLPKERMAIYLQMVLKGEPNIKPQLIKELTKQHKMRKSKKDEQVKLLVLGETVSKIEHSRLKKAAAERDLQQQQLMTNIRNLQEQIKEEVLKNIEMGNSKSYDLAITNLLNLKSMYKHFEENKFFSNFMNQVSSVSSRKSAFKRKLKQNGLTE